MISAVILTKNEEKNIEECIKSLSWCSEIIVVDDNSTDKTEVIAERFGAKVYKRKLDDNFAAQRNYGLEKSKGDWVLFVDADERVSKKLADEIIERTWVVEGVKKDRYPAAFRVKRVDTLWGKRMKFGELGDISLVRLARRDTGKWKRQVHEYWNVKGLVKDLRNPLDHYPHPSLEEFINDIEFYSTLHAKALAESGERSSIIKVVFWPILKFIRNWILKLGFLDGTEGIVFALLMSFHSYLAWSKLWLSQRKKS